MFDDRKYSPALLEFAGHSVHSHFLPTLPPCQSMAGGPRISPLCLRRGGLRAAEASAWARLLRSVHGLPECLRVGDLPCGSGVPFRGRRHNGPPGVPGRCRGPPVSGGGRAEREAQCCCSCCLCASCPGPAVGAGRPASVPPTTPCPAVQHSRLTVLPSVRVTRCPPRGPHVPLGGPRLRPPRRSPTRRSSPSTRVLVPRTALRRGLFPAASWGCSQATPSW